MNAQIDLPHKACYLAPKCSHLKDLFNMYVLSDWFSIQNLHVVPINVIVLLYCMSASADLWEFWVSSDSAQLNEPVGIFRTFPLQPCDLKCESLVLFLLEH